MTSGGCRWCTATLRARSIGYLGRSAILGAREHFHREEDVRESGATIRRAGRAAGAFD